MIQSSHFFAKVTLWSPKRGCYACLRQCLCDELACGNACAIMLPRLLSLLMAGDGSDGDEDRAFLALAQKMQETHATVFRVMAYSVSVAWMDDVFRQIQCGTPQETYLK